MCFMVLMGAAVSQSPCGYGTDMGVGPGVGLFCAGHDSGVGFAGDDDLGIDPRLGGLLSVLPWATAYAVECCGRMEYCAV